MSKGMIRQNLRLYRSGMKQYRQPVAADVLCNITCHMLHVKRHVKFIPFTHTFQRRKPRIEVESNQDGSEQESLSEQERFMTWMEIIFTLRKNRWYVGHFL